MEKQTKINFKEYMSRLLNTFPKKKSCSPLMISHNKYSVISGNQIHIHLPTSEQEQTIRQRYTQCYTAPYQELLAPSFRFDDVILDPLQREIKLVYFLEKIRYTLQKNEQIYPTIRLQAPFTGLSTFKQPSDTSDLTCLELQEKNILIDLLLKMNCRIKVVCTLDIELAYQVGYTCEQLSERIADMCREFERFEKYQKFSFVIDDLPSPPLDNLFIFDTCLMLQSSAFKSGENYSIANFSSNQFNIKRAIIAFDTRYEIIKNHKNPYIPQSASEYIYENLNRRLEELIKQGE
jgi:hypothetical protein